MKFFSIIFTFIVLTLAIKDECSTLSCFKKCTNDLIVKHRLDYPCITEQYIYEENWFICMCGLGEEFHKEESDCRNNCVKDGPKFSPDDIKKHYCEYKATTSYSDQQEAASAIIATATEPGKYFLPGVYPNSTWYSCLTIDASDLSSPGTVISGGNSTKPNFSGTITSTTSSKESGSSDDDKEKPSSTETKSTENGAQFLGIPLISLIGIVLL